MELKISFILVHVFYNSYTKCPLQTKNHLKNIIGTGNKGCINFKILNIFNGLEKNVFALALHAPMVCNGQ